MATPLSFWFGPRGLIGFRRTISQQGATDPTAQPMVGIIPAMSLVDTDGNPVAQTGNTAANPTYVQQASQAPTAGTDLSGTVTTTSGVFNLPVNPNRRPGDVQGQNVSANTIGFNEFGGTAVIGAAGTYTVPAGATFAITTTNQVNFIAAGGNSAVTITRV